jgi:hypothetical protein
LGEDGDDFYFVETFDEEGVVHQKESAVQGELGGLGIVCVFEDAVYLLELE